MLPGEQFRLRQTRPVTGHVHRHYVQRSVSASFGVSVCEQLVMESSAEVGPAEVLVSCPRGIEMRSLVATLETFLNDHPELPRGTHFWLADLSARSSAELETHLRQVVRSVGYTVLVVDVWEAPTALQRAHCLQEIAFSREVGARFELALGAAGRASFDAALADDVTKARAALAAVEAVDVRKAHTTDPTSLTRVLSEGLGAPATVTVSNGGQHRAPGGEAAAATAAAAAAALNAHVKRQLRAAYLQLGRRALGRLPQAQRGRSRIVDHLGLMSRQVEVVSCREILGNSSAKTLTAINNLAMTLKAHGDEAMLKEAGALYRECLGARRVLFGDRHPSTLLSINNLGAQCFASGDLKEAEALLAEALHSRKLTLGPRHPSTMASAHNLATMLWSRAKDDHAKASREQARLVNKAAGGKAKRSSGYSNTGREMTLSEANMYVSKAKREMKQAETMLRETLDSRQIVLGSGHPDALKTMNALGSLLYETGEYESATPLYRKALSIGRSKLGDRHPVTLTSMNNLGNLLHTVGMKQIDTFGAPSLAVAPGEDALREATELLREALEKSREILGGGHLNTLISTSNLGALLRNRGELDEAAALIRDAVEGVATAGRRIGGRHPHLAYIAAGLRELDQPISAYTAAAGVKELEA